MCLEVGCLEAVYLQTMLLRAVCLQAVFDALHKQARDDVEQTVVVRIDALKVLTPSEILSRRSWHLQKTSQIDAMAVLIEEGICVKA